MAGPDGGSLSGLTDGEAREFHRIFVKSFIAFMGWAFLAHMLVWYWRPWGFSSATIQQSSLEEGVKTAASLLQALV